MPTMSFMPQLKDFLLKNGVIYTVRKYRMIEAVVDISGVGQCNRIPLGTISSREDLIPYVGESGFLSVDDWWAKVRYFIPSRDAIKYLYKVDLVKEQGKIGL